MSKSVGHEQRLHTNHGAKRQEPKGGGGGGFLVGIPALSILSTYHLQFLVPLCFYTTWFLVPYHLVGERRSLADAQ